MHVETNEQRIQRLDVSLFDAIPSQSNTGDRLSWLALQRATRSAHHTYAYLEIGSHLGGSMQSHLLDPLCVEIYSIDKRCIEPPDERDGVIRYPGNSTGRMLGNLRRLAPAQLPKVRALEGDAKQIGPSAIAIPPTLCFIDGEHTIEAAQNDFWFCLEVCDRNAVIYFHDDVVIYRAIHAITQSLEKSGATFRAAKLGGSTFAIGLGDAHVLEDAVVQSMAVDGARFLKRRRLKSSLKRVTPAPLVPVARAVGSRL